MFGYGPVPKTFEHLAHEVLFVKYTCISSLHFNYKTNDNTCMFAVPVCFMVPIFVGCNITCNCWFMGFIFDLLA